MSDSAGSIVVAVLGSSQASKQEFLQHIRASQTRTMFDRENQSRAAEYETSISGRRVLMVDTPTFRNIGDWQSVTLETLTSWMWKTAPVRGEYSLTGIIYLHSPAEFELIESSLSLWQDDFTRICKGRSSSVVLATMLPAGQNLDMSQSFTTSPVQDLPRRHALEPCVRRTTYAASEHAAATLLEMVTETNSRPAQHDAFTATNSLDTVMNASGGGTSSFVSVSNPGKRSSFNAFGLDIAKKAGRYAKRIETKEEKLTSVYRKLQNDQIRLIELQPRLLRPDIVIRLVTCKIADLPEFEAVSWVWGPDQGYFTSVYIYNGPDYILCPVQPSLESMLKTLRHDNKNRLLWIDALAINQRDKAELSQQVGIASSIYEAAKNVCIWLGPSKDDSDLGMDYIRQILNFSEPDELAADEGHGLSKKALARIMLRDWFSRRWVVPEIAFARRATVLCGRREVSWEEFCAAASLFGSRFPGMLRSLPSTEAFSLGDVFSPGAESVIELSEKVFREGQNGTLKERLLTLEHLLAMLPMYEVTRRLDAVYSLLPLGKDTYNGREITVDYERSAVELFMSVVKLSIESTGCLDIICRPWAPKPISKENYPSWICTVSKYPFLRHKDGKYERQNADTLVGLPEVTTYRACGDFLATDKAQIYMSSHKPSLQVHGVFVARVTMITPPCAQGVLCGDVFELGNWVDRHQPVPSALLRTLIGNRASTGSMPPPWYKHACEHAFRKVVSADVDIKNLIDGCSSPHLKAFLNRVKACTWGRVFFQANISDSTNPYLGFGPRSIKQKDHIAVLIGCNVPVILREHEESYELIGECYLDKFMGGEALRNQPSDCTLATPITIH